MGDYDYVTLQERPELLDAAADWFHAKWDVPKEAYLACMTAYLKHETEYGWYLCLNGNKIIGGLGVSGGSEEQDTALSAYGRRYFETRM